MSGEIRPEIALVCAIAENGVIGHQRGLAWHLRSDLKQFKARTLHHAVIMGRRTWQSLPAPLPSRLNIILTRQQALSSSTSVPNIVWVHHKSAALQAAFAYASDKPAMIIGGADIYRQFEADATQVYLTRVHGRPEGDTRFTLSRPDDWEVEAEQHHEPTAHDDYAFSFLTLRRASAHAVSA